MVTAQYEQARFDQSRPVESSLDEPAEFWAPPLAPAAASAATDAVLREAAVGPATGEDAFEPAEYSDFAETGTGFASRRKLMAGAAIVAVLAAGALGYFFFGSPGDKAPAQTAEAAAAVQSEPAPAVQEPPRVVAEAAPVQTAVAWPDLPASVTAEAPVQVAAAAPVATAAPRPTAAATQSSDVVFLQRPGVNIRSTPATSGTVLGTAPKGARFKVTKREGDWVQVENARLKGWISAQFVAAKKPQQ